jgi:hypothetical protein
MSAEIINLAGKRPVPNPGNGARKVMLEYWRGYAAQNGICPECGWPEMMSDNLLAFLWIDGFKVTPLGAGDAEYDGPDWTGEEKPAS